MAQRDDMAELLNEVRVQQVSYFARQLVEPWTISVGRQRNIEQPNLGLHWVTHGQAWLRCGEPILLKTGDLAFVLMDGNYELVSPQAASEVVDSHVNGHRQPEPTSTDVSDHDTSILCGSFTLEAPLPPIATLLPSVFVLRGQETISHSTSPNIETLVVESLGTPKDSLFVARLVEILLLSAIRRWALQHPESLPGWSAAIYDPRLGNALARMHSHSQHRWTVENLAALASMSKSAFCERFRVLVGVPPMQYLTELRMRQAARWLHHRHKSVANIAEHFGYCSEASFRRAFKRTLGVTPGQVRQRSSVAAD